MSDAQKFYLDNMKSKDKSILGGKNWIFGGTNWIHWMIMMGFEFTTKDYMQTHNPKNILNEVLMYNDKYIEEEIGKSLVKHHVFVDNYLKKKPMATVSNFRKAHLRHN